MYSFRVCAAWLGCPWLCLSPAIAAETVIVDLGTDGGEMCRRERFLHGFSDDGQLPPDSMVVPLEVRLHRMRPAQTWANPPA